MCEYQQNIDAATTPIGTIWTNRFYTWTKTVNGIEVVSHDGSSTLGVARNEKILDKAPAVEKFTPVWIFDNSR